MDPIIAKVQEVIDAGPGDPLVAPHPVNRAMIRHWCSALGDEDPVYLDDEAASRTRFGGVIAPPAMLGVWTMETPRSDGGPRDLALRAIDAAGYDAVVATDYEHEYVRPLRPGDRLTERRAIESIVGPKRTALGEGYFVATRYDYHDDAGDLVGTSRMRLLKFRPTSSRDGPDPAAPAAARPRPAVNRDTAHWWAGLAAGELRLQRCSVCTRLRHPPGPMCPACNATEHETIPAAGTGTVASFVVHHHPPLPGFELPLTIVCVTLDEGPRVVAEYEGDGPPRIGDPVEVTFAEVGEELTVPRFRRQQDTP